MTSFDCDVIEAHLNNVPNNKSVGFANLVGNVHYK